MMYNTIAVFPVDSRNLNTSWTSLKDAIHSADIIGLDLEMSGIASRESIKHFTPVENYYAKLCEAATNHSILSLGIACFKDADKSEQLIEMNSSEAVQIESTVFDVLLFCRTPYTVDPSSLQYLVRNGFDFNAQYQYGVQYTPAFMEGDKLSMDCRIKELFLALLHSNKPIAVHNGLTDLVFLYHHFYAPLPSKWSIFTADLAEMFEGGIYDTKRIPINELQLPTFLQYLLYKSWYTNNDNRSKGRRHIDICTSRSFISGQHVLENVRLLDQPEPSHNPVPVNGICRQYASYGYCPDMSSCKLSHNLHHVLLADEEPTGRHVNCVSTNGSIKRKRKRKRKTIRSAEEHRTENTEILKSTSDVYESKTVTNSMSVVNTTTCSNQLETFTDKYKSGCDAFATGFYLLVSALQQTTFSEDTLTVERLLSVHCDYKNRLHIMCKSVPLLLVKSLYSKTSSYHRKLNIPRNNSTHNNCTATL